jgi:hypothetical protein
MKQLFITALVVTAFASAATAQTSATTSSGANSSEIWNAARIAKSSDSNPTEPQKTQQPSAATLNWEAAKKTQDQTIPVSSQVSSANPVAEKQQASGWTIKQNPATAPAAKTESNK